MICEREISRFIKWKQLTIKETRLFREGKP